MKRKGSLFEQIFFTEALKQGLEVFVPLGDYLPQDCIVMNRAGRSFRVQIKGTSGIVKDRSRTGIGRYMVTAATGSMAKDPIDCSKVDVLAAYVEPMESWYIIPTLHLDGAVRISMYPHNPKSKAKHEQFKDNWNPFKINWEMLVLIC